MSVLEGFPFIDQRTKVTTDGLPSENANDDCVAAAVLAACMYLNGIKTVGGIYTPDNFKDAAYGQGYVGFTAASQYVTFCASLGVKLYAVEALDYPSLLQKAHEFLASGKPVIFTQDDWIVDTSLEKYQDWTHVAAWYADAPGSLTSMDPWGGFARMKSDAVWITLLRGKAEIWIAERIEELKVLTIAEVAYFFEEQDATHWLCKQTGHSLHDGMLTFYKGYSGVALCGLTWLGLPKTDEIKIEEWRPPLFAKFAGHGITIQFCECGVLCYDPGHLVDQRPGLEGAVYLLQLYSTNSPGQDPGITKLQSAVADLQNKLAQSQATNPQLLTDMQQIRAISGKY